MSNVSPIKEPPKPVLSTAHQSALLEIRRQLTQAHALVSAAHQLASDDGSSAALTLLDMAEDILADHEWINRMDELQPPAEA